MGCLLALGSMAVVVGIFFVVYYVWGMTGFWIMAGLVVIIFFMLVLAHGDSEEDYYYDD